MQLKYLQCKIKKKYENFVVEIVYKGKASEKKIFNFTSEALIKISLVVMSSQFLAVLRWSHMEPKLNNTAAIVIF